MPAKAPTESEETAAHRNVTIAAALLGKRGGERGGPARAAALSKERRTAIAKLGGQAAKRARGK